MTTLTTLDILKKGRSLIAHPARWTRVEMAKDKFGQSVPPLTRSAACFCSLGALERASGRPYEKTDAYEALSIAMGGASSRGIVAIFNDNKPHAEVVAAWDRAIKTEETQQ